MLSATSTRLPRSGLGSRHFLVKTLLSKWSNVAILSPLCQRNPVEPHLNHALSTNPGPNPFIPLVTRTVCAPFDTPWQVYFSGCSWLSIYHVGVAQALTRANVPLKGFSGASSGSLVAACLASGVTPPQMYQMLMAMSSEVNAGPNPSSSASWLCYYPTPNGVDV
eukprot:1177643-Prorocentrum_minimum.AAC.2